MGAVNINRAVGQLNRTTPTEDAVVCMVMSGVAVAGKIALGEHKQIFSTDALADLGITAANNALAYQDVKDFYANAGNGAELNIMLVSDATSITDICDNSLLLGKKLLEAVDGRGVIFIVNVKKPVGYVPTITAGLDNDVNTAVTKLQQMAVAYSAENNPFVGVLPALGFNSAGIASLPLRTTYTNDYVALNAHCNKADGVVSMGLLAGWLAKCQVHQNIARVRFGKMSDTSFMPDGTPAKTLKNQWETLLNKGLIVAIKRGSKSGFFYNDDPCLTTIASDYSSISWNRTINKAHRISHNVLLEKLNDDVDVDETTGKIEGSLISDWESDVENAIREQMAIAGANKKAEISGVKCTIDPNSDIVNDKIEATINIVRKGQAKTINVRIGYVVSI